MLLEHSSYVTVTAFILPKRVSQDHICESWVECKPGWILFADYLMASMFLFIK